VSWWQVFILCWLCFIAGFFTAALMAMARDPEERRDD
jgi:hypothetical protein